MRPYGFGADASQQGQAVSVWLAGEQDRQTGRRFMETAVGVRSGSGRQQTSAPKPKAIGSVWHPRLPPMV